MSADAARRHVALSFDDGPDPVWTPAVLAALAEAGTQATFFVMGAALERWPELTRATLEAGHDLQLHCHEHRRHTTLSSSELATDTDRALAALARVGVTPTRWRTPWGVLGSDTVATATARELTLTGWTTDTEDWAGEPWPTLLARVDDGLHPGAVVLAHDGLGPGATRSGCAETVALIGPLVETIRALGLEPGPIPAPSATSDGLPPGAPAPPRTHAVGTGAHREARC